MRTLLKFILVAALAAPLCARASTVLWFSVDVTAPVVTDTETYSVDTFIDAATGKGINAVRVRVSGSGVPDDTFLMLYFDGGAGWESAEGLNIAELAGAQYQPADMSGYALSGNRFTLELGYIDMDDESAEFTAFATAEASYDELLARGYTSAGGVSVPSQTPWTPTYYVPVPEPSSALLLVLGAAVIASRRRRL